jgi:hypothetical protein
MKATKAYIASLGTTGVLLAASILMLAVVSAVVAFDRWPGANAATPLQTLVLTDKAPPIRVSARSTAASATPAAERTAGTGATRAPETLPDGGGVAGERFGGGTPTGGDTPARSTPALVPAVPKQPSVEEVSTPIFDAISNPSTTAGQIADGTQAVTDAAGTGLTTLDPNVGGAVSGTGDAVAQTIRAVPLPGHILPGH